MEQPAEADGTPVNEDDEPDELPSPGFSYEEPGTHPHQDSLSHEPEADGTESGPMQDNAQSTYGEPSSGIYHHSSGLTFPDSLSPEVTQQMWTSGAGTDYSQASSMHGTTNNGLGPHQQFQEPSNTLSFPDQRGTASTSTSHTGTHQQQKSWGSYTSSQRSAVAEGPAAASSVSANNGHVTTSWPAYSTSDATGTKNASASPRQSRRTTKANNVASTYNASAIPDGMHHASALALAAMNSAAARTASPVQGNQYEDATATTTSRAKSRQGMRPQTRTPVPNHASGRAAPPQRSALPTAASSDFSATGADKSASSSYNNSYSQYSTVADQSSNGLAYQPYSQQQNAASTTTASYPNYNSYARSHNTNNTLPLSNSTTQQVASSYNSSTPSTANQWGDSSSSQTRNSLANTSTTASPSVNLRTSTNQRAHIPPSFNVRPQAPAQASSRGATSAAYGQTPYSSYPSQPQQQTGSSQQQQQQGWYTGSSASGYGTGTGGARAASTGSHGAAQYGGQHQNQNQQPHAPAHHAMNLSGHTYSSMGGGGGGGGGEQGLYNMLPGGGSGH